MIGFILVGKTIAFAELLQLAAQGFVEWLYSAVVILLIFFYVLQ